MHVSDPLLVLSPHPDHGRLRLFAGVEDADRAIAVAGAKDVAGDLIGGEGCDTRPGTGGDVLVNSSVNVIALEVDGYICANFSGCIPHSNDFDVSCYEKFALALLPVQDEACILRARD